MKVILKQDVKKLGNKGDIVDIAEGYARNYLIPRELVIPFTKGAAKEFSRTKQANLAKKKRDLEEAKETAEKLSGKTLVISSKAGETGRLFGSITNKDIVELLRKQFKIKIDKRKVVLPEPLKSLGTYSITIRLHSEVQVEFQVQVVEA